jgi:hypothetical protein
VQLALDPVELVQRAIGKLGAAKRGVVDRSRRHAGDREAQDPAHHRQHQHAGDRRPDDHGGWTPRAGAACIEPPPKRNQGAGAP